MFKCCGVHIRGWLMYGVKLVGLYLLVWAIASFSSRR